MLTAAAAAFAPVTAAATSTSSRTLTATRCTPTSPATLPAERLNVQSQKTDTVAVQRARRGEAKRMQDVDKVDQNASGQNKDQQQATQLTRDEKAKQCTKARQRYDTYMNSQRLYEQSAGRPAQIPQ